MKKQTLRWDKGGFTNGLCDFLNCSKRTTHRLFVEDQFKGDEIAVGNLCDEHWSKARGEVMRQEWHKKYDNDPKALRELYASKGF